MNKVEKPSCIQILLIEDHEIVRCGLKGIFEQQEDIQVISEASSFKDALTLDQTLCPDVILLDLMLSDGNCIERIPELTHIYPDCKILIFTASSDKKSHLLALQYGAVGILHKDQSIELLCKAIRSVYVKNDVWIDKTLTAEMWRQHSHQSSALATSAPPSLNNLTPREKSIACLSSKGLSAKKIGEQLFISEKTVRNQLTLIYSKLGVKNQLELSINISFPDDFS